MYSIERVVGYLNQRGVPEDKRQLNKLTPAQNRRTRHKLNRVTKRLEGKTE